MADKPVWRHVYDRMATEVGPRLTQATASDQFAGATSVLIAVRRAALRDLQRNSRRWLHMMNLPAGSDVRVLRKEIGELERQVRDLSRRVEQIGVSSSTERQVRELGQRVESLAAATAPASNGRRTPTRPGTTAANGRRGTGARAATSRTTNGRKRTEVE